MNALFLFRTVSAADPWHLDLSAETFSRSDLLDPEGNGAAPPEKSLIPKIKSSQTLAGEGWVEYDFTTPETGWYEILFLGGGSVGDHDFWIDGGNHVYGGVTDKVANAWLTAGQHVLRAQRLTWTGLGGIKGFRIQRSDGSLAATLRVQVGDDRLVFRVGEALHLDVFHGGHAQPLSLTVWLKEVKTNEVVDRQVVSLDPTPGVKSQRVTIPCKREGVFYVSFGDGDRPIAPRDLREIQLVCIDAMPTPHGGGELKKTLIKEIDCAAPPPANGFYFGGGETRVIRAPFGQYRESGEQGYLQNNEDPSFFAYTMDVDEVQRPYLIEVDYPDDALRTFCIGLEEREMMDYPPAGGVDSGGEFSLSHRMQTQAFIHWPRGKEQRILFFNAQNGRRAAASKIRIYRIEGGLPALKTPTQGGRHFGYWLEEGDRWATFQGAPDKSLSGYLVSMKRWAEGAAYMGADTLAPTLAIYQNALYPSKFYDGYFRVAAGPRDPMPPDLARMLLLVCEKYGLKFLPDFHPTWNGYKRRITDDRPYDKFPDPKPHLMVSKDGKTGEGSNQPYFNPIYPDNMRWYVGMFSEFADRYKDSPALMGIAPRVMAWVWESRNGWPSLNWGYEDYTVDLFQKETGIKAPVGADDPQRFQKRYAWLRSNAKEEWTAWRCEKLADLYRRILTEVRKARPDLGVFPIVHGPQLDLTYYRADEFEEKIEQEGYRANYRECGYDMALLEKLSGLGMVNAQHYYGRRQPNNLLEQEGRDHLIDPEALTIFRSQTGSTGYLFSNSYFEANQVVAPEKMGLKGVKPGGFVGVVNPAGRHYLERYALLLAEGDADLILDGGEGYLLGQAPYLHEFLSEYRNLPPERFTPRPDARDPVAVWDLKRPGDFLFYAVNRERFPVKAELKLKGRGPVRRLSSGAEMPMKNGSLLLELQPYQLMAFSAPPDAALYGVITTVSPDDLKRAQTQVAWLKKLADDVREGGEGDSLFSWRKERLFKLASEAEACLKEGRVWRARTILENHVLLEIYDALRRYPPHLRDLGSPVVPSTAMRADALLKMIHPTGGGEPKYIPSETVSPLWTGDSLVGAASPKLELPMEAPVANRYRITLGHATGGEYGPLECRVGDRFLGLATDDDPSPHGAVTFFNSLSLPQGTQPMTLERKAGSQTALFFLDIQPVYRDITARSWSVIGPFSSLQEMKTPGDGLAKVYPPEEKRDFSVCVPGENGKMVGWEGLEGDSDYMNLFEKYHLFTSGITYAVTYIHSPTARLARLSYGVDYWAKIWLNGQLAKDLSQRGYAPAKGQFTLDANLQAGWNELLVKVHSGGAGNGFWMAISDPGDLEFASQRPWPMATVPAAIWRVTEAPANGPLADTLLKKDAIGLPKAEGSSAPIPWAQPTLRGEEVLFKSTTKEGKAFFVGHLFAPLKFHLQPYQFRLVANRRLEVYINGQKMEGEYDSQNTFTFHFASHQMREGCNRVVVAASGGGETRFKLEMSSPGDVKFFAEPPPELDPERHVNDWPSATLSNGLINAQVAVPDLEKGFYRGNRFEQAGIVTRLEYKGHTFFLAPKTPHAPLDSGWCAGAPEEWFEALAWDDAQPGEPFIKMGVGLYERPCHPHHMWYCAYWPVKMFPWTTKVDKNSIEFTQAVEGPRGWGYRYVKRLVLVPNKPILRIEHELTNTGQHPIEGEQYNHNFVRLDDVPIGKGYSVTYPMTPDLQQDISKQAVLQGKTLRLTADHAETTHAEIMNWSAQRSADNSVFIASDKTPAEIKISGDFAPSKSALFFIPEAICHEPFIHISLPPGAKTAWTREYEFIVKTD